MLPRSSLVDGLKAVLTALNVRYGCMRVIIAIILVLMLLCTGCTLNFKGTDVELEGEIVRRFELESLDILKTHCPDQDRKVELCMDH